MPALGCARVDEHTDKGIHVAAAATSATAAVVATTTTAAAATAATRALGRVVHPVTANFNLGGAPSYSGGGNFNFGRGAPLL